MNNMHKLVQNDPRMRMVMDGGGGGGGGSEYPYTYTNPQPVNYVHTYTPLIRSSRCQNIFVDRAHMSVLLYICIAIWL